MGVTVEGIVVDDPMMDRYSGSEDAPSWQTVDDGVTPTVPVGEPEVYVGQVMQFGVGDVEGRVDVPADFVPDPRVDM